MTTYNIQTLQANTYKGATFTINVNGSPLNLTGASLLLQVKTSLTSTALLTLTESSGLSISNPTGGEFKILPQIFNLPSGQYYWDILITLSNGEKDTYIGGTLTITGVYSHG